MELPINYNKSHWTIRKKAREQYIKEQDGKCQFCNALLTENPSEEYLGYPIINELFPKGFFNHSIHLHHNHKTGMTIGAVHAYCNAFMWQYHGE